MRDVQTTKTNRRTPGAGAPGNCCHRFEYMARIACWVNINKIEGMWLLHTPKFLSSCWIWTCWDVLGEAEADNALEGGRGRAGGAGDGAQAGGGLARAVALRCCSSTACCDPCFYTFVLTVIRASLASSGLCTSLLVACTLLRSLTAVQPSLQRHTRRIPPQLRRQAPAPAPPRKVGMTRLPLPLPGFTEKNECKWRIYDGVSRPAAAHQGCRPRRRSAGGPPAGPPPPAGPAAPAAARPTAPAAAPGASQRRQSRWPGRRSARAV